MRIVTVTSTAPLLVRETATSAPLPARLVGRGDAYTPAVDARVLVEMVGGRLYVLGAA